MTMRLIADDSDPLPYNALQERGEQLLRQARGAAAEAMVMSVQREFFFRGARMNLRDVEQVRLMAREAAAGWVAVESALAELGNEVEKTKRSTIRGVTQ